jgi:hypothetical protein
MEKPCENVDLYAYSLTHLTATGGINKNFSISNVLIFTEQLVGKQPAAFFLSFSHEYDGY